MKPDELRELAANSHFIPGIYNYCDRWCERCAFSHRCLNYAMERAEDDGDPAARDLTNQKFWSKLHQQFQDTIEMVRADAKARGFPIKVALISGPADLGSAQFCLVMSRICGHAISRLATMAMVNPVIHTSGLARYFNCGKVKKEIKSPMLEATGKATRCFVSKA